MGGRALTRPQFARRAAPSALLPVPTGDEVRVARTAAGHTQSEAAQVMGYSAWARVSEIESGRRPIDAARWTWYLLATGQHPTLAISRRATTRSGA